MNDAILMLMTNSLRLATIGQWPESYRPDSIADRIPIEGKNRAGFNAIVACGLSLIPRERQYLTARLQVTWNADSVQQIRREIQEMNPDSETCWWLAAESLHCPGGVTREIFVEQVTMFEDLVMNPEERRNRAIKQLNKLLSTFHVQEGFPLGTQEGCIQGAYIAGHRFGTEAVCAEKKPFEARVPVYIIGTYLPSLGLEHYSWKPTSGPVQGSPKLVQCATYEEMLDALKIVKQYLGVVD